MCVRGVEVDYSTHSRWIQKYASELDKRCKPHLKPTNPHSALSTGTVDNFRQVEVWKVE